MRISDLVLIGVVIVGAVLLLLLWARAHRASQEAHAAGQARAEAAAEVAATAERYQQSVAYLSGLGDASLDTLLLLDADRKILWGNQAAWAMFGPAENAVGQTFIGLVHDYELNQAVLDATSGGRSIVRQAVVNGRTLRIRAVPVSETGGAAVAIEDVTELQRLGRARRDFVANLSHELRTDRKSVV